MAHLRSVVTRRMCPAGHDEHTKVGVEVGVEAGGAMCRVMELPRRAVALEIKEHVGHHYEDEPLAAGRCGLRTIGVSHFDHRYRENL